MPEHADNRLVFKCVKDRYVFLFLLAGGFLLYSASLFGEFVYDDYAAVVSNPAIRNLFDIPLLFDTYNTRFLTGVSFALNFHFHGLHVFGYHALNVVLHAASAFCIYILVLLIFKTPVVPKQIAFLDGRIPALFSSLLFLSHPLQTQAVSFITQRAICLAAFFYLFTLVCYARSRLEKNTRYYAAALLSAVCAMLSKEVAFTLPVMITAYELFFFGFSKENIREKTQRLFPFYVIAGIIPLLLTRDLGDFMWHFKEQVFVTGSFNWIFFLTYMKVLVTYLALFIFPVDQNIDHDYPLAASLTDVQLVVSAGILLSLIAAGVWLFKRNRMLSFCIFWFFTAAVMEWGVVSVVHDSAHVIYEHWAYLPTAGFTVFFPVAFFQYAGNRKKSAIFLSCIICVLAVLTFQRNKVWSSELALWQDAALKSPNKATSFYGLAASYGRKGMNDQAISSYQKSISLHPHYPEAYNNLGVAYQKEGRLNEARACYEKAVSLDPKYARAYYNLGVLYESQNNTNEAVLLYQKSVEVKPSYVKGYIALGLVYAKQGQRDEAMKYFEKAARIDPLAVEAVRKQIESTPK